MKRVYLISMTLAGAALGLLPAAPAQDKANDPPVKIVDFAGLGAEVVKHRGKVVLADFWYTT